MISARSDAVFATGSEIIGVSFNGSGGIAYSNTYMQGTGSTSSSSYGYQTATSWMRYTNTNGTTTNTFGSMEIYIPSYTASQKKQISAIGVSETNATAVFMGVNAGLWSNTAAITSVTLGANYDSTRNFLTGSSFYLYGIQPQLTKEQYNDRRTHSS